MSEPLIVTIGDQQYKVSGSLVLEPVGDPPTPEPPPVPVMTLTAKILSVEVNWT